MSEILEAKGLSVTRSCAFSEKNYEGTRVYVSVASKLTLPVNDQ